MVRLSNRSALHAYKQIDSQPLPIRNTFIRPYTLHVAKGTQKTFFAKHLILMALLYTKIIIQNFSAKDFIEDSKVKSELNNKLNKFENIS